MNHTPMFELAIDRLQPTLTGALEWCPGALAELRDHLDRALDGEHGPRSVEELLRLMSVLRGKYASGAAADALAKLLRTDARSRMFARRCLRLEGGVDAVRGLGARVIPLLAPTFGVEPPQHTIPLRALLDPGRERRVGGLHATKGAHR